MTPPAHRHRTKVAPQLLGFFGGIPLSFRLYPSSLRIRPFAFTLIEIVLVLSLVAIITAAAVPAVNGLREEAAAREPITALAKLAKETRLKAMQDKRPYQIAFTSRGFTATRYLSPYLQAADLESFLQAPAPEESASSTSTAPAPSVPTDPDAASNTATTATAPAPAAFVNWTKAQAVPEGTQYTVQFWHESAPTEISGETVKLWVFQPTGIVVPLTVTLTHLGNTYSATFNAMTADIDRLRQL